MSGGIGFSFYQGLSEFIQRKEDSEVDEEEVLVVSGFLDYVYGTLSEEFFVSEGDQDDLAESYAVWSSGGAYLRF